MRRRTAVLVMVLLVAACTKAPSASPSATATQVPVATIGSASARPTTPPVAAPPSVVLSAATYPTTAQPWLSMTSVAAAPDGGVWALVGNEFPDGSGSILALLGPDLQPRPGWPLRIPGWTCGTDSLGEGWPPVALENGSVQIMCTLVVPSTEIGDDVTEVAYLRALEISGTGQLVDAWDLTTSIWYGYRPRIVNGHLLAVDHEWGLDDGMDSGLGRPYWIVSARTDGRSDKGVPVEITDRYDAGIQLAPDGAAFVFDQNAVTAFDSAGIREGWPTALGEGRSWLGFNSQGGVVATDAAAGGGLRFLVSGGTGGFGVLDGHLPMAGTVAFDGAGEAKSIAPLYTDGDVIAIGETADGIAIESLVDGGAQGAPWPFRSAGALATQGSCGDELVPGCGFWRSLPALSRDGVLLLPLAARSSKEGDRLQAVGRDARALPGWPVQLQPGFRVFSVAAGSDGGVFTVVAGPGAGIGSQVQILSISRDGSLRATLILATAPAA